MPMVLKVQQNIKLVDMVYIFVTVYLVKTLLCQKVFLFFIFFYSNIFEDARVSEKQMFSICCMRAFISTLNPSKQLNDACFMTPTLIIPLCSLEESLNTTSSKHIYNPYMNPQTMTVFPIMYFFRWLGKEVRSLMIIQWTRSTWLPHQSSRSQPSWEMNGWSQKNFLSATPASPPASDRKWALTAETRAGSSGSISLRRSELVYHGNTKW